MVTSVADQLSLRVERGVKRSSGEAFTDEGAVVVKQNVCKGPRVICSRCGATKTLMKKKRSDGKGYRKWSRCDACKERVAKAGGRATVDGRALRELLDEYGGSLVGYREALKKAQKEEPLFWAQNFESCPECGGPMSIYEEVRHDRGGTVRVRKQCIHCRTRKCGDFGRAKRGVLTERAQIFEERKGLSKKQRTALNREKANEKKKADRFASQGWGERIQRKYGLSKEAYLALLKKQNYQCAMDGCDFVHRFADWFELSPASHEVKGEKHHHHYLLVVDHCHSTGKVRGLLCSQCNLDVGAAEKFARRQIEFQSLTDYVLSNGNS